MYGYIDSNGNKHLLSGQQDIPQYTMEQYTALSVKPDIWICTDYDSSSEYGIDDTNVKHGNTSVNEIIESIKPVSLGGIANNETKTLTIPDSILEQGGVYLLSLLNTYGAGGVYILKRNTATASVVITTLSPSSYLTLTSVDSKSFTVAVSGIVVYDTHIMRL